MAEQPYYSGHGVTVTRQLVSIPGASFPVGQVTGVGLVTERHGWRGLFKAGLGMLLTAALCFWFTSWNSQRYDAKQRELNAVRMTCGSADSYNSPCKVKERELESTLNSAGPLAIAGMVFGGLLGLVGLPLTLGGAIRLMRRNAGNALQISTANGSSHVTGISFGEANRIKTAIERAMTAR